MAIPTIRIKKINFFLLIVLFGKKCGQGGSHSAPYYAEIQKIYHTETVSKLSFTHFLVQDFLFPLVGVRGILRPDKSGLREFLIRKL